MRRGQLCGIRTRFFSDIDYALEGFASAYYADYPNWDVDVDKNYEPIDITRLRVLKLQMGWSLPELFKMDSVAIIPSYFLTNWQPVKTDLLQ
ncbi:MAG: hypothetical protein ACI9FZ_000403 [Bacteroidia bacterium]|jgi:hypothetical protein